MSFEPLYPNQDLVTVTSRVEETTDARHPKDSPTLQVAGASEHAADGTENNCDSIKESDPADNTIWSKITPKATDAGNPHHLDAVYGISLPPGFSEFQTNAIAIEFKTTDAATVEVKKVVDSEGTAILSGFPAPAQSATKSTIQITKAMLTAGTFTPGTLIFLHVRGQSPTAGTPFTTQTAFIGSVTVGISASL